MKKPSALRRAVTTLLLPSLLPLALAGCDEDTPPPGVDAGPETCAEELPAFETGGEGAADPLSVPSGEVRAGRLRAVQLPEDPNGLLTWAAGDFALANDRVALVIEDVGASDGYDPYGGRPVGIAAVEGGALARPGDFNEVLYGFGGFLVQTEEVTVVSDGSDGGPALIRAIGPLGPLEFAGDLLAAVVNTEDYTGLPAAMDYELAPGSDAVEIYMSVGKPDVGTARTSWMLSAFFQAYRMPIWLEGAGFQNPGEAIPMASFVDDEGASYAWIAPEGTELSPLVERSGVLVFSTGRQNVAGCSVERIHMGTMVLGSPGLDGLQQALARHRGETQRTITGSVMNADGTPAPDVRLHVRREDGSHFSRLYPAEDGTFEISVPEEVVSLFGFRAGTPLLGPVQVAADQSNADVQMPATGTLRVSVVDAAPAGGPLPARVQVLPMGGAPEIPADLGERPVRHGRSHIDFTVDGAMDLPVAPGQHDVIVSRGYEYELWSTETPVAVGADEVVELTAELDRVVDTTGIMCADYHIHTHRSPDSPDSPRLKLLGLVADGLEIPIRSDHEWVNDFQPLIEEMGLQAYAFGIGGEELTTFAWGHFGVFPLTEDPSMLNGSAIPWVGRLPPAVFADVRARAEAPVLIINHPRSTGVLGGYFNAAGFDRTTGTAHNADHWDEDFTLVEVFNDDSFEEVRDSVVADWFALLGSGRRVFAVGSSDSHGIYGSPVGYPRTCLDLGTDDPTALTEAMVRDVTAAGRSTISGGIYLGVVGPGGSGPGDEVSGAGETAAFEVTVQAASWIEGALELEVIVDGQTVETLPILETDRDAMNPAVRLRADVSVPVAADGSWVVFHVSSDGDLAPIHPGRSAFAVSNPVFLAR